MRNSNRIEAALKKLYVAFHEDQLHPECCKRCAVGNILDNNDSWKHLSDHHGAIELNYVGNVHESLGRKFNGYSPLELMKIEATFLNACGYKLPLHHKNKKPVNPTDKDVLFKGLCAVVKFLCELDNIPDAMDYTKLFEYEKQKKEKELVALA